MRITGCEISATEGIVNVGTRRFFSILDTKLSQCSINLVNCSRFNIEGILLEEAQIILDTCSDAIVQRVTLWQTVE